MAKKQISIKEREDWRNKRLKIEDKYAEKMAKEIKKHRDDKDNSDLVNALLDIMYDDLTETYSMTEKEVDATLGKITHKKLSNDVLKKLTYNKDGKTLEERVKRSCSSLYLMLTILHTENQNLYNQVVKELAKILGYVAASVITDGNCDSHEVNCADYEGLYLLSEAPEPPFHPNCECELEYYMLDDLNEAEIEELGLKDLLEQGDDE